MNHKNIKLAGSGIAGILFASLILISLSVTTPPYMPSTTPPEPKFLRAIVGFTDLSAVNLTVIKKYGGEVVDSYLMDFIAAVVAKIPRENVTKLAEEDIIHHITYEGITWLYGEKEPTWNATVEVTHEQIKLTMYLEKTVFQLGEDVKLKLALTNIGEQNVTLTAPSTKRFDFVVYDSNHNEIHRWSRRVSFLTVEQRTTLKPGETKSEVPYKWEQIRDISDASVKYDFLPVSPGTYYIVGETLFEYDGAQIPQTPPIEITILQT
jgi:hypothetical protein